MSVASFFLEFDPSTGNLELEAQALRPQLRTHRVGAATLHFLGHPIADERRDDEAVRAAFERNANVEHFAGALDGNFLILVHDQQSKSLHVISDRFGAYACYWARDGHKLLCSLSLVQLIRHLGSPQLDPAIFVEFLHFRRLFGEKTYDRRCSYLTSAGILHAGTGGVTLKKYWQPDYTAPRLDRRSGSEAIVQGLCRTMQMHLEGAADGRRYALFMSGGLDSRALLTVADPRPACITTCSHYNNEAAVAEQASRIAGAPFAFVPRPEEPYEGLIDEAIWYGGGQHIVTEAHFLGYDSLVGAKADCFLLGLGLDVFLGGLYLPKSPVNWLGRDALHYRLNRPGADLATDFMMGVKYRLWTTDPWIVVKREERERLREAVHDEIATVAGRGRALGAQGFDLWEYLHLHNFSRHYSFLMIQSVRHWAECRAPGLCNDMLDVAIRLPAELKVNSSAYLAALRRLSPELMRLRNANTNIAAGLPLAAQSMLRAGRIAINRLTGAGLRVSPAVSDRSWPPLRETLRTSQELTTAAGALATSERLVALGCFDLAAIARVAEEHARGRHDHSTLLITLITLDQFLRRI